MNASSKKQFSLPTPRALLPIGHPDRDKATVVIAKTTWQTTKCTIANWEQILNDLREEQIWERYPPEKPYGSLDRLLKEEIGLTADESIKTIKSRTESLSKTTKPAMKHGSNRFTIDKDRGDNYNVNKDRGTSAEYLASVIARDHPEIHNGMKAGKYRSVRQAAIEAGLVKPRDQWSAPGPIEKLAALIRKRYTPGEIDSLITILQGTNS